MDAFGDNFRARPVDVLRAVRIVYPTSGTKARPMVYLWRSSGHGLSFTKVSGRYAGNRPRIWNIVWIRRQGTHTNLSS